MRHLVALSEVTAMRGMLPACFFARVMSGSVRLLSWHGNTVGMVTSRRLAELDHEWDVVARQYVDELEVTL